MTNFNERIAELEEFEGKATQGEWEEYDLTFGGNVIKKSIYAISHTLEQNITDFDDPQADINRALICALRNEALPLLREMAQALSEARAENERLRQGIKDIAEKYAEMEKLRSQFYTEKEQAETALLFANRENKKLREGIARAVEYLQHQFGYDDVLALEQEFRQISFGDAAEFMDFRKELEALQNDV